MEGYFLGIHCRRGRIYYFYSYVLLGFNVKCFENGRDLRGASLLDGLHEPVSLHDCIPYFLHVRLLNIFIIIITDKG